ELVEVAFARGDDLRLVAQTEVVVGREDHDLAAPLHLASCGLRPLEVVQAPVDPVLLELLEFGLEPGGEAHAISRMILPASPARMAARASSIFASGNWCVITGRGSSSPVVRYRRIWCHVSYILRPITPYTVIPLKMISRARSTGTSPLG